MRMSNDGGEHFTSNTECETAPSSNVGSGVFIDACTKKVKDFRRITKTVFRAIGSSIEADVGIGIGAHFEGSVGGLGISVGNSGNYWVIAVDDGQFSAYSTYSEEIAIDWFLFTLGYKYNEIRDFNWNTIDAQTIMFAGTNDSISIAGGKTYIIPGGSWNISFNFVEFINTLSEEFDL